MEIPQPKLTDDKLARFRHGIEHWNAEEFFECHEVLEDLWLEAGNERRFYQGLIQAAAGFYKVQLDSQGRGVSLLQTAIDKLALYPDCYLGIDVRGLIAELRLRLEALERSLAQRQPIPEITFPRLKVEL